MSLKLQITGSQAAQPGVVASKTFDGAGGVIGRAPDCDWVLSGQYVSGRHARIHYRDGGYYIEDTSSNGVFLGKLDNRLMKGELYLMRNGDRLLIDDMEIVVSVEKQRRDAVSFPQPARLMDEVDPFAMASGQPAEVPVVFARPAPDPMHTVGLEYMPRPDEFEPPPPEPVRARRVAGGGQRVASPTGATGRHATGRHPQLDLAELLQAAGIPSATPTPGLARELGRVLRVAVSGLMEALRARDKVKNAFRIRHTTFRAMDNNPLKFSANVDDALFNLMVKRNPAYLDTVESLEEAFSDIRHHEMAMLAGMRMACEAMLKRFDPRMLEEKFDESGKRGALLAKPARLRYWEQFNEYYRELVKDPETSFKELFGAEFTSAYEERLQRLRNRSRNQKRES
jgi:type VI secretion system FHA domain protein